MLKQSEADALIALPKKRKSNQNYNFPLAGGTLTIPIVSMDGRRDFLIDLSRGRIKLTKCSYQERYQAIIILIRLDVDGPPHTNPDVSSVPLPYLLPYNGQTITCPHLHLYVEDFMDRWAIPAPTVQFPNITNLYVTLQDFFRYCNIIDPPIIRKGIIQRRLFT